jgi:hypothetical protein
MNRIFVNVRKLLRPLTWKSLLMMQSYLRTEALRYEAGRILEGLHCTHSVRMLMIVSYSFEGSCVSDESLRILSLFYVIDQATRF